MAISYLYTGEPMNGTTYDDFVIAFKGSTGTDNNTINGNNGDDLVIADSSDTWIPNSSYLNGSIGTAFNLETLTSTWTTAENEMFGDWTIPHTTVMAEATIGQSEYYRIQIGAGQQITIDLDFASNTAIGVPRDLVVELQDSLGNIIVTADDSLVTDGGQGSVPSTSGSASSYDPYLVYTVPSAGIYYINVRPFGGGPGSTFTENNTFLLNVSVTGHAVNATNPVQGADTINGGEGNDTLFGQGGGDVINGDAGDDFIDAGAGGDIVHGGEGNDTLYGGDGSEENIHGDNGDDKLVSGGEGHYYGDAGNDLILAGLTSGVNEILDGGADVDTIDTRTWNGAYAINLVTGATNFGESFINFENAITGNGADTITGTAGANTITTNAGIDIVDAGAGNDIVAGGADGDTLDGGADFDILSYRLSSGAVTINVETNSASGGHAAGDTIDNFEGVWGSVLGDTLTADTGDNELRGFEGNDVLSGGAGNDLLDGGINDDTMTGGLGDDTYYVDSLGDVVNELAGQGTDTLALGFSYTLANGSALEWLATIDPTATTAINLTGNSSANSLTGNAGANILNGGGGADTMAGLGGDDRYYIDTPGDTVIEASGQGNDLLLTSISYTLSNTVFVESLSTSNWAATTAINITGNDQANTLVGNAGANILDGGAGADVLQGREGDDRYYLDNAGDTVIEATGEGNDLLLTSVSYVLGNTVFVESLSTRDWAATTAINITGNDQNNTIIGNAGANVLNGAGGADILQGLGGNDLYIVNLLADQVLEAVGGGTDEIRTGLASYSLAPWANVENLSGVSASGHTLTGNAAVNTLTGATGNDVLDGGTGADILVGGFGDDRYYLDDAGDQILEGAGGGNDILLTGVDYVLAPTAEVESLTTRNQAGTEAIDIIANDLANAVVGNAGANILRGAGGNDIIQGLGGADYLYGGAGNDRLFGGTGADLYVFNAALNAATNVDKLEDYVVADDGIVLDRDFFSAITVNGTLAASAFCAGAAAADADDRVVYNAATGQIFYDADGSGAGAQILFATVAAGTALTNLEFSAIT